MECEFSELSCKFTVRFYTTMQVLRVTCTADPRVIREYVKMNLQIYLAQGEDQYARPNSHSIDEFVRRVTTSQHTDTTNDAGDEEKPATEIDVREYYSVELITVVCETKTG